VTFPQSGSSSTESKFEFRSVDFCEGRKNRRTRRKALEARERTKKQLYSHISFYSPVLIEFYFSTAMVEVRKKSISSKGRVLLNFEQAESIRERSLDRS
jgi:hypothetical protein